MVNLTTSTEQRDDEMRHQKNAHSDSHTHTDAYKFLQCALPLLHCNDEEDRVFYILFAYTLYCLLMSRGKKRGNLTIDDAQRYISHRIPVDVTSCGPHPRRVHTQRAANMTLTLLVNARDDRRRMYGEKKTEAPCAETTN